jgi:hypothetical protein
MISTDKSVLTKSKVVEAIIAHKLEFLRDFESEEKNRLAQVAGEDIDNRHIDSKNEETLHDLDFLNHNVEILEKQILLLKQVDTESEFNEVKFGSLVNTDMGHILVACAQEKMEVAGKKILGISTAAPIYRMMEGLKAGDTFEMNGMKHTIKSVV